MRKAPNEKIKRVPGIAVPPPPPPPPPAATAASIARRPSRLSIPAAMSSSFSSAISPPRLPRQRNVSSDTRVVSGGSSTNLSKVPGGGVPWATIAFLLVLFFSFAFGLLAVILAGQKEKSLRDFLYEHWDELDCGIGPTTIVEARKSSGLLRKKVVWVLPPLGTSYLLACSSVGATYLLRKTYFTQWLSCFVAIFSLTSSVVLVLYSQMTASLVSLVFTIICIVWQISWHDSRHWSMVLATQIGDLKSWALLTLSVSASASTILVYAGYFWVLYALRQIWDTSTPNCTNDRLRYLPRYIIIIVAYSFVAYWITQVISCSAQTLAASLTRTRLIKLHPGLQFSSHLQPSSWTRTISGSLCYGAALVSLSLFLKDLGMGLMQNISLAPTSPFRSSTAALLMALVIYLSPLHSALHNKINDWGFVLIGLDGTKYWKANQIGGDLMSSSGLDVDAVGLSQMIQYIPLTIAGISAISTYLLVTIMPGPILATNDVLSADVLVAFAFFGGMQISRAVLAPYKGAMCTIYLMMVREPRLFRDHHSVLWNQLVLYKPVIADALLKKDE